MNHIVIIGAGQSGRGFIPQFLGANYKITFIDCDKDLVASLKDREYSISYYGERESLRISNYEAYEWSEVDKDIFKNPTHICISVGEQNYQTVIHNILDLKVDRISNIIMFENGINPAESFERLVRESNIEFQSLSQCAIFTTTNNDGINIKSEDGGSLYYDAHRWGSEMPFVNTVASDDFGLLMERKIYTYNFLSAIFAYHGYIKGNTYLSEIYTSSEFKDELKEIKYNIDTAYSKHYNIDYEEQAAFSLQAIKKFSNQFIQDDIKRNARDVQRKLSTRERIYGPYMILKEHKLSTDFILNLIESMICYGVEEEGLDIMNLLATVNYLTAVDIQSLNKKIKKYINN